MRINVRFIVAWSPFQFCKSWLQTDSFSRTIRCNTELRNEIDPFGNSAWGKHGFGRDGDRDSEVSGQQICISTSDGPDNMSPMGPLNGSGRCFYNDGPGSR